MMKSWKKRGRQRRHLDRQPTRQALSNKQRDKRQERRLRNGKLTAHAKLARKKKI